MQLKGIKEYGVLNLEVVIWQGGRNIFMEPGVLSESKLKMVSEPEYLTFKY